MTFFTSRKRPEIITYRCQQGTALGEDSDAHHPRQCALTLMRLMYTFKKLDTYMVIKADGLKTKIDKDIDKINPLSNLTPIWKNLIFFNK
ncbi:MAG: hypothetical protein E3K38_01815 [Candidatus Kuenenia stuttgartiensis]|nr:hypothetical protein [Candidatus Kuenenia stuttgartiensis]